jgi:hypothetical protein
VVRKIVGWEKLKAMALDSVSSPITKRVYNMACARRGAAAGVKKPVIWPQAALGEPVFISDLKLLSSPRHHARK